MSEEKIESLMRGFVEAFANGDVEKTLSFLAEDASGSRLRAPSKARRK